MSDTLDRKLSYIADVVLDFEIAIRTSLPDLRRCEEAQIDSLSDCTRLASYVKTLLKRAIDQLHVIQDNLRPTVTMLAAKQEDEHRRLSAQQLEDLEKHCAKIEALPPEEREAEPLPPSIFTTKET